MNSEQKKFAESRGWQLVKDGIRIDTGIFEDELLYFSSLENVPHDKVDYWYNEEDEVVYEDEDELIELLEDQFEDFPED
jgi:hypothetical protein